MISFFIFFQTGKAMGLTELVAAGDTRSRIKVGSGNEGGREGGMKEGRREKCK